MKVIPVYRIKEYPVESSMSYLGESPTPGYRIKYDAIPYASMLVGPSGNNLVKLIKEAPIKQDLAEFSAEDIANQLPELIEHALAGYAYLIQFSGKQIKSGLFWVRASDLEQIKEYTEVEFLKNKALEAIDWDCLGD